MCSGSKAGSYLRLIDFVHHSTLGLRMTKNKQLGEEQGPTRNSRCRGSTRRSRCRGRQAGRWSGRGPPPYTLNPLSLSLSLPLSPCVRVCVRVRPDTVVAGVIRLAVGAAEAHDRSVQRAQHLRPRV